MTLYVVLLILIPELLYLHTCKMHPCSVFLDFEIRGASYKRMHFKWLTNFFSDQNQGGIEVVYNNNMVIQIPYVCIRFPWRGHVLMLILKHIGVRVLIGIWLITRILQFKRVPMSS